MSGGDRGGKVRPDSLCDVMQGRIKEKMVSPEHAEHIPDAPGVYFFKDTEGKVLYVGKANRIRTRVRTHLSGKSHVQEQSELLDQIAEVDYVVTNNEVEALLLEHTLIKKHLPRYNVRLKDDKRYPFIKVTMGETFPRAYVTRTMAEDGSLYFGPYARVKPAREALRLIKEIFPIRSCRYPSELLTRQPACIQYEIKRCVAPCIRLSGPDEYRRLCEELVRFLEGRNPDVRRTLEKRMRDCSEGMEYEKATIYRDRIAAVDDMQEKQIVVRPGESDRDVVGLGQFGGVEAVAVMSYRDGKASAAVHYYFEGSPASSAAERLGSFLVEFYSPSRGLPKEILLRELPEDHGTLEAWLTEKADHKCEISVPQRGKRLRLLELAEKNASLRAEEQYRKTHGFREKIDASVPALQETLGLPDLPVRIEGYDISNIQGVMATGAMVVFQGGRPHRSSYRKFRIRREGRPDDYAMMQEMIVRRFAHREDLKFGPLPDLVLIDGGIGHLRAVVEVMEDPIPVISIAKKQELIYTEGSDEPLALPLDSPALRLLIQIRDESHRFGLGYHRKLREKALRRSVLDEIEGIGKKRKRALLLEFGSVEGIRAASVEDIAKVPGISTALAETIKRKLDAPLPQPLPGTERGEEAKESD
jgi:excinuclease ABC subunit C